MPLLNNYQNQVSYEEQRREVITRVMNNNNKIRLRGTMVMRKTTDKGEVIGGMVTGILEIDKDEHMGTGDKSR
jgi:hypothetical protein